MLQPVRGVTSKHADSWVSRHCVKSAAPCVENLRIHECIADVLGVCLSQVCGVASKHGNTWVARHSVKSACSDCLEGPWKRLPCECSGSQCGRWLQLQCWLFGDHRTGCDGVKVLARQGSHLPFPDSVLQPLFRASRASEALCCSTVLS